MTTTTPQCRNCKQRRVHAIPPCHTLPTPSGDETEKKNGKKEITNGGERKGKEEWEGGRRKFAEARTAAVLSEI